MLLTLKGEYDFLKKDKNANKAQKKSSKNLKISTRIVLTAVFAIVIPLIIIASFSPVLITTISSFFNFSTVTTNTYSTVNQIQWSQTLSSITGELISDKSDERKLNTIKEFVSPLEKLDSVIYIEKNGKVFYKTSNNKSAIETANSLVPVDKSKNLNYFGENGLVIVNRANAEDENYLVVIVNENYTVNNALQGMTAKDFTDLLLGRTGIIVLIIVLLFVIAIVVISLITSRTIVEPIKKIAYGADEIARGNLDYEIEYKSTNELGQTVKSFNAMRYRLKNSIEKQNKAEEARKELVAGIAHDVRTPLTSAKGYAEGLLDGIADTPEKQKRYVQTICTSINDTERILNDLLTVSRLELSGYRLNKVDVSVSEFFDDGALMLERDLEEKGFDFEFSRNCSESTIISIDPDLFERVISNIISNSIRYSRENVKGKIKFTLNEYDKTVILEIKDNGIGIDKSSLPKIFDTMYRADPARTKISKGSGLGLSICKQIVELHGGIIWASSNEGDGLSIFISLPKKEVL